MVNIHNLINKIKKKDKDSDDDYIPIEELPKISTYQAPTIKDKYTNIKENIQNKIANQRIYKQEKQENKIKKEEQEIIEYKRRLELAKLKNQYEKVRPPNMLEKFTTNIQRGTPTKLKLKKPKLPQQGQNVFGGKNPFD
jgi:hypothetical protein